MDVQKVLVVLSWICWSHVWCLDNGLARTPPMGWESWERFGCNTDCTNYPNDCLSENLIKSQVDALVNGGYHHLGYRYVTVDDCWQSAKRDKEGLLQADAKRFPNGIKSLADYVHQRGLKLGLFTGAGHYTCSGYPGSKDHYQLDAQTFAKWGVDMVKLDGCNVSDPHEYDSDYPNFGNFLNKTGRPMLYACSWILYQKIKGVKPNYGKVAKTCNTFRSHAGMGDNWESLEDNMKYFGQNTDNMSAYAGPGNWNDPDLLLVGDYGLSLDEQRMQMAIWTMLAAPLFVSADMTKMPTVSKSILQNKALLAINQDPLGQQGHIIIVKGQIYIWRKAIKPEGSFALMFIFVSISGGPSRVEIKLADMGLTTSEMYTFTDVFSGQVVGQYKPWYTFNCEVNPTGVRLFTAIVNKIEL